MYATPEQIEAGVWDYIKSEIIPIANDKTKLVIGTATNLFAGSAKEMEQLYGGHTLLKAAKLSDGSGRYDVERLKNAIIEAANEVGVSKIEIAFDMPILNKMMPPLTLRQGDGERMYQAISAHI